MRSSPTTCARTAVLAVALLAAHQVDSRMLCSGPGAAPFLAAGALDYTLTEITCHNLAGERSPPSRSPALAVSVSIPSAADAAAAAARTDDEADRRAVARLTGGRARSTASPHGALIEAAARQWGHDPALVHAIVQVESAYAAHAVSPKGAIGLMQIMPATARRYGLDNVHDALRDPEVNLQIGTRLLADLKRKFDGDLRLALAAYNAGEQAVINHARRVPPYPETRSYVKAVIDRYLALRGCTGTAC